MPTDRKSEFFQEVALTVNRGLISITEAGTIVFVNPSFEEITGHTSDQILGNPLPELVVEQTDTGDSKFLQETLASTDPELDGTTVEVALLNSDNSGVWVTIEFNRHTYGGQHHFTGLVENISDRRRKHELERYENIITKLPLGINRTETGQGGRFLEGNRSLAEILEVPSLDLLNS